MGSQAGHRQLDQFINSDPSIYLSPFAIANQPSRPMVSGSARSEGFVFGYQDRGHYYLLDWKKVAASYQNFGVQPRGMRLREVHVPGGQDPTGADFWSALNVTNSTTLRTNDLAWVDGADYDMVLRLRPGLIELEMYRGARICSWSVTNNAILPDDLAITSTRCKTSGRQIVLESIARSHQYSTDERDERRLTGSRPAAVSGSGPHEPRVRDWLDVTA